MNCCNGDCTQGRDCPNRAEYGALTFMEYAYFIGALFLAVAMLTAGASYVWGGA